MATVYNPPDELPWVEPDYKNYDYRAEQKREAEYTEKLKEWLRARYTGDLVGEIIRTSVADGYAQYMIEKHRPFALIHLPFGDKYSAGKIWEKGCTLKDAREMVERSKGLAKLFAARDVTPP
jgi:hypothetical protein